jgi:hypothetical protein
VSSALLLCAACIAAPLIALEVVRKVRDWRVRPGGDTVWVGVDLASGKDICVVHVGTNYRAVDHSSCGTIDEVSA